MPKVDPNTGEPMSDDPSGDPELAGGKGPGEVEDAAPSGRKAFGSAEGLAPQGIMVGERDRQSLGETPT